MHQHAPSMRKPSTQHAAAHAAGGPTCDEQELGDEGQLQLAAAPEPLQQQLAARRARRGRRDARGR